MKQLLIIFTTLCLLTSCSQKRKKNVRTKPTNVLEFKSFGFNSGITLGFRSDSTYYMKSHVFLCTEGMNKQLVEGRYQRIGNELRLTTHKKKQTIHRKKEDKVQEHFIEADDREEQKDLYLSEVDGVLHLIKFKETLRDVIELSKELNLSHQVREINLQYYRQDTSILITNASTQEYFSDFIYTSTDLPPKIKEGVENRWDYRK